MQASDRQANQARWRGACGAGSRAKPNPNGRGHAGDTNSQKIEIPRLNPGPGTLTRNHQKKKRKWTSSPDLCTPRPIRRPLPDHQTIPAAHRDANNNVDSPGSAHTVTPPSRLLTHTITFTVLLCDRHLCERGRRWTPGTGSDETEPVMQGCQITQAVLRQAWQRCATAQPVSAASQSEEQRWPGRAAALSGACLAEGGEGCSEFGLRDGLLPNSRLLIGCESASNRDPAEGVDGWTRETDGQERVCREG